MYPAKETLPHDVSCPLCRAAYVCNYCGKENVTATTGRCTNGRCADCCRAHCKHVTE